MWPRFCELSWFQEGPRGEFFCSPYRLRSFPLVPCSAEPSCRWLISLTKGLKEEGKATLQGHSPAFVIRLKAGDVAGQWADGMGGGICGEGLYGRRGACEMLSNLHPHPSRERGYGQGLSIVVGVGDAGARRPALQRPALRLRGRTRYPRASYHFAQDEQKGQGSRAADNRMTLGYDDGAVM